MIAFLVLYLFQVFSDAFTLMGREVRGCSFCFHMVAFIHKYSPIEQPGISPVEQPGSTSRYT